MNPQWNTPPDGDFARYVEQLSARSAVARRASETDGEHGLDVGMAPSAEPHQALPPGSSAAFRPAGAQWQRSGASRGGAPAIPFKWVQSVAVAWLLVLLVMFSVQAPLALILAVLAGGVWLAHRLRDRLLPTGTNGWRGWLDDMARKAREQQHRQGK